MQGVSGTVRCHKRARFARCGGAFPCGLCRSYHFWGNSWFRVCTGSLDRGWLGQSEGWDQDMTGLASMFV